MIRSFGTIEEWQLSQYLYGKLQPWQRTDRPLPSELDEEVLLVFRALFAKSGSPQSYVYQLREFYRATRDFRLLAVLADSVLGHSAGKVYPFLQNLHGVLDEIRDEATADSLVERIASGSPASEDAGRSSSSRSVGGSGRAPGRRALEPAGPACRSVRWPRCNAPSSTLGPPASRGYWPICWEAWDASRTRNWPPSSSGSSRRSIAGRVRAIWIGC